MWSPRPDHESNQRSVRKKKLRNDAHAESASIHSAAVRLKGFYVQLKYGLERAALTMAWNVGYKDNKNDHRRYTEKRFREVIVGVQAQLHSKKRNFGLYFYVRSGDLVRVQQMIANDPSIINKRDAAGAAAFHLAYVFQHYHIGHYLVEQFPELGLLPYNGSQTDEILEEFPELNQADFTDAMMPYTGATILHVAIVRRNYEEVRWLLNFYYSKRDIVPNGLSKLLSANVTGKFFAADGDFYLGGLPLHFAVCANHTAIVDIILSYAGKVRIEAPDYCLPPDQDVQQPPAGMMESASSKVVHAMKLVRLESSKLLGDGLFGSERVRPSEKRYQDEMEHGWDAGDEKDDDGPELISKRTEGKAGTDDTSAHRPSLSGHNILFLCDLQGNTVLHLCVRYGLREMYAHLHGTARSIIAAEVKQLYAAYAHKGVGAVVRLQAIPRTTSGYCMLPKVINIPELDRYDEWLRTETEAKLDERLVLALNSDLHSPLTLAAAVICRHESDDTREKRILMFQHLLQYNKTPLWTYGAIKVSRIKLEGIEIKYKLERYQHIPLERFHQPHHAAIDWLCINDADPRVIQIPEIKSFIETKWERCGYPSFLVRFLVHTGITILITLIMLFPNVTPRFVDVTPEVVVVDVLYPIVGATFAWIMVCEVQDFMKYGRYFWALRGVARYDKVVRCVKVASFLIFAAYKIAAMNNGMEPVVDGKVIVSDATDHALKVSLTICVMSSWLHVYYFLMGFESTGPFMLTIFRIVGRNVPYFMRFYAVVVVTFACGLSLLSNNGTLQPGYAFMNLLTAVWTLLQVTVGADPTHNSIDIHTHVPAHLYWLADLLLTTYYASVVILMINLLIAMIGHTYEEYISYNSALLLIEKYNIMHAVERSMCAIEYEYYRSLYSHRVKVTIDSLVVSSSYKQNSLSRAVSGFASIRNSTKGSARGIGEFAKHVTVEHSNYDFELQEVNDMWFSDAEAHQDAARSKAASKAPPQIILFLICPQNDYYPGGAMGVENAAPSAKHLETLILEHGSRIKQIVIALATHQYGDLTHPSSWESYQGERPTAGTKITYKALLEGDWQARNAILQEWYELYAKRLESEHRRSLTILPEHCIIGTRGHSVHQSINSAVQEWAARSKNTVQYVHFGSNKRAYMYSAMQAAVEDPLDASTALNTKLLNVLLESDQVLLCGPDLSHSVRDTVQSLLTHAGHSASKFVVLRDGGEAARGEESSTAEFLQLCQNKGCTVTTCSAVFPPPMEMPKPEKVEAFKKFVTAHL